MQEWKVEFSNKQPSHYGNPPIVLIVEAPSRDDAAAVAKDHNLRRLGVSLFNLRSVEPYQKPVGRVVG
jgi:hypothetical protein